MSGTETHPNLQDLPENHVDRMAAEAIRDPNRPMHRRTDIAIGFSGKQIWKKIPEVAKPELKDRT